MEPEFPRALTENERAALDFLLSIDFEGAAQLREQAQTAVVMRLCPCGCPTYDVSVDRSRCTRATVAGEPVPVDAVSNDPPLELLLFVRGGWLEGVELVYYGDESPRAFPPSGSFGSPIHRTIRAPNANAHIERWVGSVRRECLDRVLIFNRRQLERVLRVYVRHYNEQRPHRALDLQAPDPGEALSTSRELAGPATLIRRRDLLDGLIHEYQAAAA